MGDVDPVRRALRDAVSASLYAPSILNTQPWRWRLHSSTLDLRRDAGRRLPVIDPTGRLAVLSCGAALHHAEVSLAAHGYAARVRRPPAVDPDRALAEVTVAEAGDVPRHDVEMARAISLRHSDRRPIVAAGRVDDAEVDDLVAAAARHGCAVHRVTDAERPVLADAVDRAERAEEADPAYRRELEAWTVHRPAGGGVSFDSVVAGVDRPVAVRDFAAGGETGLFPGFGDDALADYLVLATDRDEAPDWLRAGEATSAVWLTATAHRLAMSVLSDVVEVPAARARVTSLLDRPGFPQLILRVGYAGQPVPPPAASHRTLAEVLDEDPAS